MFTSDTVGKHNNIGGTTFEVALISTMGMVVCFKFCTREQHPAHFKRAKEDPTAD